MSEQNAKWLDFATVDNIVRFCMTNHRWFWWVNGWPKNVWFSDRYWYNSGRDLDTDVSSSFERDLDKDVSTSFDKFHCIPFTVSIVLHLLTVFWRWVGLYTWYLYHSIENKNQERTHSSEFSYLYHSVFHGDHYHQLGESRSMKRIFTCNSFEMTFEFDRIWPSFFKVCLTSSLLSCVEVI